MARGGEALLRLPLGHISTIELPAPRGEMADHAVEAPGSSVAAGARLQHPGSSDIGTAGASGSQAGDARGSEGGARASTQPDGGGPSSCCAFDEIAAARGCLGRFPGREVMELLSSFAKTQPLTKAKAFDNNS